MTVHPVIGELRPHWLSAALGTDFEEFHVERHYIQGCARVSGDTLDILAILCADPRKGHFREFMRECKLAYRRIRILRVMEPELAAALTRYGFRRCTITERDGERVPAMRWAK